jgi:hypothetical protein
VVRTGDMPDILNPAGFAFMLLLHVTLLCTGAGIFSANANNLLHWSYGGVGLRGLGVTFG